MMFPSDNNGVPRAKVNPEDELSRVDKATPRLSHKSSEWWARLNTWALC